jgi:hypothetical protein
MNKVTVPSSNLKWVIELLSGIIQEIAIKQAVSA